MLPNYRPSPPPLADAEHLLMPQQRAHCCAGELLPIPTFCRREGHPDDDASTATVDWASVRRASKEWLKNPMNVALLLWLLCVGVSGGMFLLLLLGLLDGAFPAAAERNHWIEINVQVLNALFTLMSLYQHPALCHHLFLLCRWRPRDAADLRAAYCKGAGAPGERVHMAVVVALLHLTVACQYAQCGLYWGYTEATRPELAEAGFFALGVAAPVAAAVYTVCSPLGKDGQHHELSFHDDTEQSTPPAAAGEHVVVEPEWAGGMFDCGGGGDAPSTWCLSLSCTFCVLGWNTERLGFGNAYVHAVTFALLCFAPLWVLGVSALHIRDLAIGDVVGGAGVLLCACGLLYGGYWRIQMRRRFGLPGSRACCGSKSLTDYARWLFCWPWALAQEVRTANLYHVDGEVLYSKQVADEHHADSRKPLLVSDHHDVLRATETVTAASQASPPNGHAVVVVDDETTTMAPPVQVVVCG
jgi:Cys-rich protein (TIGR01571 family)